MLIHFGLILELPPVYFLSLKKRIIQQKSLKEPFVALSFFSDAIQRWNGKVNVTNLHLEKIKNNWESLPKFDVLPQSAAYHNMTVSKRKRVWEKNMVWRPQKLSENV